MFGEFWKLSRQILSNFKKFWGKMFGEFWKNFGNSPEVSSTDFE